MLDVFYRWYWAWVYAALVTKTRKEIHRNLGKYDPGFPPIWVDANILFNTYTLRLYVHANKVRIFISNTCGTEPMCALTYYRDILRFDGYSAATSWSALSDLVLEVIQLEETGVLYGIYSILPGEETSKMKYCLTQALGEVVLKSNRLKQDALVTWDGGTCVVSMTVQDNTLSVHVYNAEITKFFARACYDTQIGKAYSVIDPNELLGDVFRDLRILDKMGVLDGMWLHTL